MLGLIALSATATYSGPPPLTARTAFTEWTFDPTASVLVVVLGLGYVMLMRRASHWSAARAWAWFGGLLVLVLATMSFTGAYAHVLFWPYAVQIVTLLMVVPVLLALGAPWTLLESSGPRGKGMVARWVGSLPSRVLTLPIVCSVLIAGLPFLIYFTPWYESTLRHASMYGLLHIVLILVGFIFFWSVLGVDQVARHFSYPVAFFVLFVEVIFDALPGIVIAFTSHIIAASYYVAVARPWGPSLPNDQRMGGACLWFIGEIIGIPLLAVMVIRWVRADSKEAADIDAELDARAQLTKTVANENDEDDGEVWMKPWWEKG